MPSCCLQKLHAFITSPAVYWTQWRKSNFIIFPHQRAPISRPTWLWKIDKTENEKKWWPNLACFSEQLGQLMRLHHVFYIHIHVFELRDTCARCRCTWVDAPNRGPNPPPSVLRPHIKCPYARPRPQSMVKDSWGTHLPCLTHKVSRTWRLLPNFQMVCLLLEKNFWCFPFNVA